MTFVESCITSLATVLVYVDAALASNVDQFGKIMLLIVLIVDVGLLAIANEFTEKAVMKGRVIRVKGKRKKYSRRLDMAEELIKETGRNDWAYRLGMIVKQSGGVTDDEGGGSQKSDERGKEDISLVKATM